MIRSFYQNDRKTGKPPQQQRVPGVPKRVLFFISSQCCFWRSLPFPLRETHRARAHTHTQSHMFLFDDEHGIPRGMNAVAPLSRRICVICARRKASHRDRTHRHIHPHAQEFREQRARHFSRQHMRTGASRYFLVHP